MPLRRPDKGAGAPILCQRPVQFGYLTQHCRGNGARAVRQAQQQGIDQHPGLDTGGKLGRAFTLFVGHVLQVSLPEVQPGRYLLPGLMFKGLAAMPTDLVQLPKQCGQPRLVRHAEFGLGQGCQTLTAHEGPAEGNRRQVGMVAVAIEGLAGKILFHGCDHVRQDIQIREQTFFSHAGPPPCRFFLVLAFLHKHTVQKGYGKVPFPLSQDTKIFPLAQAMATHKDNFTLDAALAVLRHPTVDAQLWTEAVEWLLLYGPPPVRELLLNASQDATSTQFPQLTPVGITSEGEPCYRLDELARTLEQDEDDIRALLQRKSEQQGQIHLFDDDETGTIQ